MKPFCQSLFFLILLIAINQEAFSQTDIHGGNVHGLWSNSGSPYRIFDDITIPVDSTLSIESGVKVEMQGHYGIYVQGRLLASGTGTASIIFTVNDTTGLSDPNSTAGGWNGIRFIDTPSENDSSKIEYCLLQYGKAVASSWHDNSGGAICIVNFDKLRISHCLLTNNSAGGPEIPAGGAINMAWSDVKLNHNQLTNNQAITGGAIHMHESDPIFHNNIITNNMAKEGGGISVRGQSNPTFEGDSILNNTASEFGGGMICRDSSSVKINQVVFSGNQAPWGGGLGLAGVDATIDSCLIRDNSADNLGGGISADLSTVSINQSSISMNTASMSGGIHCWYTTLEITDSKINENIADIGAGLHADYSQLDIQNSNFSENQAKNNGGGLHIWNSEVLLDQNQFMDNKADVGGAIYINECDPIFKNNAIANNVAREGGGVWFFGKSNPTFEGDSILNNLANQLGGGIMCWDSSVVKLEKAVIMGNHANWGAGLGLSGIKATINNCMISKNTAENLGGGIAADFSTVKINSSKISLNTAGMSGGIHSWYTTLEFKDSELRENTADLGGGMHADYSQLQVVNSNILENLANSNGAGMHIWNSDLQIHQSRFETNNAVTEGGAVDFNLADTLVFNRPYQIEITESKFIENEAAFRSGGIKIEQFSSDSSMADLFIDQCIFDKNHAERIAGLRINGTIEDFIISNTLVTNNMTDRWNGGVSFSNGCNGKVLNCEFSNNVAGMGNPGGSGISRGASVDYINCTFADNTAAVAGGIAVHRGGKASITNCIFWNNSSKQIYVKGILEGLLSELYINNCDIQYGLDSIEMDTLAAVYWGDHNIDADPLFSDPDNADYRLSEESPCVDAGVDSVEVEGYWISASLYDIEGNPRPNVFSSTPDIGAYEYQSITSLEQVTDFDHPPFVVYPNPVYDRLYFELNLKQAAWISIDIYDLMGNHVDQIINRVLEAEYHQFFWNPVGIKNGIYISRIYLENEIISKKVLLSR